MNTLWSPEEREQLLSSLDKMERAPAPAFFETRLLSRMEQEGERGRQFPFFRPAYIALVAFFLVVNGGMLVRQHRQSREKPSDTVDLQQFASEYHLSVTGLYDNP